MIIDEFSEVAIVSTNIKYFEDKGYILPKRYSSRRYRYVYDMYKKITVKTSDLNTRSKVLVKVKCEDCGDERLIHFANLYCHENSTYSKTGETPCTACVRKRRSIRFWTGGTRMSHYRTSALKRGYVFELSIKQFHDLISLNCYYCGCEGGGIDRYDNEVGYTLSNCLPCCVHCNKSKLTMTAQEFYNRISITYHNLKAKGLI